MQFIKLLILSLFICHSPLHLVAEQKDSTRDPAAVQSKIIKIEIKGHKKIEKDAILAKLESKVGQAVDLETVRNDIGSLFDMGFFLNITVDENKTSNGTVLTFTVFEKPSISSIVYRGNDELDDEELAETTGLKVYEILNRTKLQDAVEKIEKSYEDKGYFLAKVSYEVIADKKKKTVRVEFNVTENDMVMVKQINIIGAKKVSVSKLKSIIQTQEGGFFSFISDSGAFKQDAFDRDLQILNYYYFNEGYVQVKIDRPQVYVSSDKKSIYISIRLVEGEQFDVGTVSFIGDLLFSTDELAKATENKEGMRFSYSRLQKDASALTAKYGDLGYAYTNAIPRTQIREKERLVDITFELDKGQKVYINRIKISGNDKTRDKVVRRELRVLEGELYNETRKRESLANVKRLGFFESVQFNTSTPKGRNDLLDIDIVVKERNTGTITVGAGYSSFNGLVINGQVNQTNLFGRGQKLGASIDFSDRSKLFNLNFTEPYFMDTEWSVGGDLYKRERELTEYKEDVEGAAIRVGHPLAPYLRAIAGYKIDRINLDPGEDGDTELFDVDTANGLSSAVTLSLIYDKRNDRFAPSDGIFGSLGLEYAGVGGDLNYTKGSMNFRFYKKAFWKVIWRNNLNYGFVNSNDGGDVPFNKRYLLGGATTLRGFRWYTIGQRKRSTVAYNKAISAGNNTTDAEQLALRPFGGKQQFYYNLEFQFPLIEEAKINGVVFYDIGDAQDSLDITEFRSDVGFGFRWYSPIGPLRFEWGFPTNTKAEFDEDSMNFQFAIGSPF